MKPEGESVNPEQKQPRKLEGEERFNAYVNAARNILWGRYGIHVTNTEMLHLRQIAKESLVNQDFTRQSANGFSASKFHAEYDIAELFIQKMYGISSKEIPKIYLVTVIDTKEVYEVPNEWQAKIKRKELAAEGKDAYIDTKITDEFKKYLKQKQETGGFEEYFQPIEKNE